MKNLPYLLLLFVLSGLSLYAPSSLAAVNTIYLRTDCTENGSTLPGCYTSLSDINSAIVATAPNASKPLLIDVGPGQFPGQFICANVSNVTLRGSGRSNTIIGSVSTQSTVGLTNCNHLNVSSLQIQGVYYTISWKGTGTTTWTDVEVLGAGIGWYDNNNSTTCTPSATKHYWFSSRIEEHPYLTQSSTYISNCGSHWIYGSELVSTTETLPGVNFPSSGTNVVLRASAQSEIHVYGSVLRVLAPSNTTGTPNPGNFKIAAADSGAHIHIHGTGLDSESVFASNVIALAASNTGMIHANESSYSLATGAGGTITRVLNVDGLGHIHAPYMWETHPEAPNIISVNGYDSAMVTNTSDGQPHMVVYSTACASHWYDTADRVCR